MLNLLNKIINAGVSNARWNALLKNKYVLTNTICLILAVSTFPFIFVFLSSGGFFSIATIFFFLLFASGIYFNSLGLINLSRHLVLGGWALGVFTYSLFLGSETGLQYCFFSLVAAPFIIYTPKEVNQRYFYVVLAAFLYFSVDLKVLSLYFDKVISLELAQSISYFIKPAVLIQIIAVLYYYSSQENDLLTEIKANKKLNTSLKANSEELIEFSSRLKRSESSLSALLNALDDIVLEVNKEGKVIDLFLPMANEKGLKLKVDVDKSVLQFLEFDGARLGQVLSNLVSNAIKFTPEGTVQIGLKSTSEGYCFEVKDAGEGIPLEFF